MDKSSLRTSAFVAITLSTVAVTTCLLTFPLLFHFVQRMEAEAQAEMDWCYSRSRAMWKDVSVARNLNGDPTAAAITARKQAGHREQRAVFFQVSMAGGTCQFLLCFPFPHIFMSVLQAVHVNEAHQDRPANQAWTG